MIIEQLYTGCLAEAAYYIQSEREAVIIDPLRETEPYLAMAEKNNAKIKYVLETHFHADFVSGHVDLARKSGATIVFGPTAKPGYNAYVAKDGEELRVGKIRIKVLHTPGHTMESSSYLLIDENGKPHSVYTGDTLFIGDVGRPDLVQKVKAEITPQYLASLLFDSLRTKIMTLPDNVIVYPGHGAGSACGKKMDKETVSTIGKQKKYNYALRADMTRDEFIQSLLEGLVEPPQYFPSNVIMNVTGSIEGIDEIMERGNKPLTPKIFETVWESTNALVLDTRKKEDFVKAFIPGSLFIGIDDSFAPWAGTLIEDSKRPILIVAEPNRAAEVITRLARVGYDNTVGYLKGGIEAWKKSGKAVDQIIEISAEQLGKVLLPNSGVNVLDVRRKSEYDTEHLVEAVNFPLDFINRDLFMLKPENNYYIHCAGGYRSVIMASILKAHGYKHIVNVQGGYGALSKTSLPRTQHQEVNTEL